MKIMKFSKTFKDKCSILTDKEIMNIKKTIGFFKKNTLHSAIEVELKDNIYNVIRSSHDKFMLQIRVNEKKVETYEVIDILRKRVYYE